MIDTKCDIRHYSAFVAGSSVPRKGSLEPGAPWCHRDKPSLPLWRCRGEVAQRRSLARRPFPGGFLAIKSQTPAEVLTPSKYTFPRPRPATAAQAPDPAASSRAGPGPRLPSEWRRLGVPASVASPSSPTRPLSRSGSGLLSAPAHWRGQGCGRGRCLLRGSVHYPRSSRPGHVRGAQPARPGRGTRGRRMRTRAAPLSPPRSAVP